MATTTGIDKRVEEKVFRLLADYKEVQSFNEALEFFKENYVDDFGESIFNQTKAAGINNGAGVQNLDQALQLLESSNFIKNKTVYKQIGLVFGIDPEYYEAFRLKPEFELTAGEEVKSLWSTTHNFTYDKRNSFGKQQLYFRLDNQSSVDRSDPGYIQHNTIFIMPGVIQYFINLGMYRSRAGADPQAGITLLDFIENQIITNILLPFIAISFIGSNDEKQSIDELLINDILKIKDLKTKINNGSVPNLEEYQSAFNHSYTYIKSESEKLQGILGQIINGGAFQSEFNTLDATINNFYDNNHGKLELYGVRPGSANADRILRNRQLQDILAFFGDATERRDADGRPPDPEVSTSTLADAPASVRNQYLQPKLTPFDFQCFLLENISKLVDERERGAFASGYKHISKVSNNGDPGNIINTIEHGTRNQYIEELLNICPEVYGLLVPYLKISRVEYDDVGNVKLDGNGRTIEKDLKIPNFLTQNDIQNILDGAAGRAPGAGIKSFSWALDGVQPAEVDNNISATLVMHFQSVNDFFNGARSAGQDEPNFLDLIINSPAVKELRDKKTRKQKPDEKPCSDDLLNKKLHQDYQGHNFRVKICAGWATPPKEALLQLTRSEDKAAKLIKAFDDSRISLFLQLTQHTINFNQNGTLELTVQYQASLAGLLTGKTADIFDVTPKSVEEDIERQENKIEGISEGEQSDSDKEAKKKALEEIKLLKNIDRNLKYKKLLKRIFGSATPGPTLPGDSRIYSISLNPQELTLTPYKDLSPEDRQRRVKRRESETLQFQSIPSINKDLLDAIGKNQGGSGKDTGDAYSDIASKRFKDLTSEDKINIPFFFLGDLIDTVIEEIKFNNQKNAKDGAKPLNFKMFISDVEMIDPLQAFKIKNLEDLINCGYDLRDILFLDAATKQNPTDEAELNGIYRTMNIGDIPISLDAFQLWFKNNVVKKEKNTYFLLYFIKDICKELITKALSSKCFGKEFNFQQRFDVQPLTLAREEIKNSAFISNRTYTAKKVGAAQAAVRCELDPSQTELGLLMYPTDSRPKRLLGMKSYDSDTKRGIYHHFLGSACGLVKTINFSRQDQAYLRESRIQKEGALGAEQLRELYSANIDLVGNTLYKNGMYIYINPSLLGASEEYLDYLGLHGYYLVTSVKSTITPSSFDVSISALHEGIEFKDNKRLPTADIGELDTLSPETAPYEFNEPATDALTAAAARLREENPELSYREANLQVIAEAYARGELDITQAASFTAGEGTGALADLFGLETENSTPGGN